MTKLYPDLNGITSLHRKDWSSPDTDSSLKALSALIVSSKDEIIIPYSSAYLNEFVNIYYKHKEGD